MPTFDVKVSSNYRPSFRSDTVCGMFDLDAEQGHLEKSWNIDLPIEEQDWSVGLIVGPSGSGKTTVAKKAFPRAYQQGLMRWDGRSLVDNFPEDMTPAEVVGLLGSVGLNTPPSWIKPYHVLSNGERFRADIARMISETPVNQVVLCDEFTSTVDRQVAKVASHAVSKSVRRQKKKFVAVSCHYDIAEWLEPDWVYDMGTKSFHRGLLRRPALELKIERRNQKVWDLFKDHHYMTLSLPSNAHCYLATHEGTPVGFVGIGRQPSQIKNNKIFRIARIVVNPDYQGLGIGCAITDHIAKLYTEQEEARIRCISSHPSMFRHFTNSDHWKMARKPSRVPPPSKKSTIGSHGKSEFKLTASFEYVL